MEKRIKKTYSVSSILDKDIYQDFKMYCLQTQRFQKDVIKQAISEFLDREMVYEDVK